MRLTVFIAFFCLILTKGKPQLFFLQENFKGGVSVDGHQYLGMTYFSEDTIKFQNTVPAGSTLRKAFLVSRRLEEGWNPSTNLAMKVIFNSNNLSLDSSDVVGNVFTCDASNTAASNNQMVVKDVTSLTLTSGNVLITPNIPNPPDYNYYDVGFVLILLYDSPSLPATNVALILNSQNFNTTMAYSMVGLNPIDNSKDVGFSIMPSNTNDVYNIDVALNSTVGTYTIGPLYEPPSEYNDFTAVGSFYYENNTLHGLVDDTPDNKMDSTDALANIKTFISNNSTTFTVNIDLHVTSPGCIQAIDAFIFAYSSPCPVNQNMLLQNHVICGGGNDISLSAVDQAAGNSYKWFPAAGLQNSSAATTIANPTLTTNYVVTITDNLGCHHTEMHRVTVDVIPKIDSIKTQPYVCGNALGNAVVYTHTNTISPFMYDFGAGFQSSNSISSTGGTYTVVLKDNYGCGDTGSFTIPYINPAAAQFSLTPDSICSDLTYQLINSSTGVNTYNWYIDGSTFSSVQNPIHTFTGDQTYTITLIAYNNLPVCADTVSHTLHVLECSISVSAPNIFTPNADNINDTWQLIVAESGSVNALFEIHIFDRWGIEMFESTDKKKGWDGRTTAGLECVEGTYFYIVKYQATTGNLSKNETLKGFLQLER